MQWWITLYLLRGLFMALRSVYWEGLINRGSHENTQYKPSCKKYAGLPSVFLADLQDLIVPLKFFHVVFRIEISIITRGNKILHVTRLDISRGIYRRVYTTRVWFKWYVSYCWRYIIIYNPRERLLVRQVTI